MVRVRGECLEVIEVRSQGSPVGLRKRHDECVDGGTTTRSSAQKRRPPRQRFGNLLHDIAGLQEAVGKGVATGMAVQALDEDDGRDHRRPKALLPQSENERRRLPGPFGKPADSAGIEDEHARYPALRVALRTRKTQKTPSSSILSSSGAPNGDAANTARASSGDIALVNTRG